MSTWFGNLSIRHKITSVVLATSTVVLLIACAALFAFQSVTIRRSITSDLTTVAQILAANSTAAVAFEDAVAATELLGSLRAKPTVVAAWLEGKQGTLLGRFGATAPTVASAAAEMPKGDRLEDGHLWITEAVVLDGKPIGALHLKADFATVYHGLLRFYAGVLAMVLAGATILVVPLSSMFQRVVSAPILRLAATAQVIADGQDYAVRAIKETGDEIGRFTETFNAMLAEIQRQDVEVKQSRARFEAAVLGSSDGIWDWDLGRGVMYFSPHAKSLLGLTDTALPDSVNAWMERVHPEDRERVHDTITPCADGRQPSLQVEYRVALADGSHRWLLTRGAALRDDTGTPVRLAGSHTDITGRKEAERALEDLNSRLRDVSRQAGMAEVATGVLHNVGNVLNSVVVSCGVASERLRRSKLGGLGKAAAMLAEREADAGRFLSEDPKGQLLPKYLVGLAAHLEGEHVDVLRELDLLQQNIDHIKEIVAMQQSYATVAGCLERVALGELIEDALQFNEARMRRHGISVRRDFQPTPPVLVDRHKVLQILINFISNAKHAVEAQAGDEKWIDVSIRSDQRTVCVRIADNGVGIPEENLLQIFNHGFTTKRGGHGFGLHSGANAAKEMGGQITVESAGPGRGAAFTLELPLVAHVDVTPRTSVQSQ